MLSDPHRQHLVVAFRHLDETLSEVLRQLGAQPGRPLFTRLRDDVDPAARVRVANAIDGVREDMRAFMARYDLQTTMPALGATHVARSRLDLAMVSASELGPGHLRGYGALTEADADELEVLATTLRDDIGALINLLPEQRS